MLTKHDRIIEEPVAYEHGEEGSTQGLVWKSGMSEVIYEVISREERTWFDGFYERKDEDDRIKQ